MSRVTFLEKPSFAYVKYDGKIIGWINLNGFRFYKNDGGITWNTFTNEEKTAIKEREAAVKKDTSAWGR
jgi:hypothetical protein